MSGFAEPAWVQQLRRRFLKERYDCFSSLAMTSEERDKLTRRANHFCFSEIVSSPGIKNIPLSPSGKSLD
jgi:hypothetical protein